MEGEATPAAEEAAAPAAEEAAVDDTVTAGCQNQVAGCVTLADWIMTLADDRLRHHDMLSQPVP
jgi:hypothetical protein